MAEKSTFTGNISQYLSVIKASIRGDEQDFTSIPVRTAVILLAIPAILELVLESVFAVVDIFFVNKLGDQAGQVVGLTESVITIIYSVGIGMSAAATALVARRIGEKDSEAASRAGAQAILVGGLLSIVLGLPGFLFADDILQLMGAEPETVAMGANYARIMFGGNVIIIMLFLINGIFRGAGNAAIAMKSLILGNIFNILLDPLFIFGIWIFPEMGVTGAAVATTIGRFIGILYQIYHLRKASGMLHMKKQHFKPDVTLIRLLTGIATPATLQFIIASASWIILSAMIAKYGSEASAGYTNAIRLIVFFILPAWGMSNAVATLVGQNLGAKQPARAEESVMLASKYMTVFMLMVTFIFMFFPYQIVHILVPAEQVQVITYAVIALRIVSSAYIFYGIGMILNQVFNGAGDTKTPTLVYFVGFWLFQLPLAYVLHTYTTLGVTGIFWAVPIAETAMAIAIYVLYRKGSWKTIQV